jgi:hypothetical protein
LVRDARASVADWLLGIGPGAALSYPGIIELIDWLKDEKTAFVFPQRFLPPALRS